MSEEFPKITIIDLSDRGHVQRHWRGYGRRGQALDWYVHKIAGEVNDFWQEEGQRLYGTSLEFGTYAKFADGIAPYANKIVSRALEWVKTKQSDEHQARDGKSVLSHYLTRAAVRGVQNIKRTYPLLQFDEIGLIHETLSLGWSQIMQFDGNKLFEGGNYAGDLNTRTAVQAPRLLREQQLTFSNFELDVDPEEEALLTDLQVGATESLERSLSSTYRQVITLRFGLGAEADTHSYKEIGLIMGKSRKRVTQIEIAALHQLRFSGVVLRLIKDYYPYNQA